MKEGRTSAPEESREQAARSISAALEFLRQEAEAAGLDEVSDLIQRASAKAKASAASGSGKQARVEAMDLPDACRAIGRLPDEYRTALIMKKVYRHSVQEIASDCSVSVATARDRIIKGFQLVRTSLRDDRP